MKRAFYLIAAACLFAAAPLSMPRAAEPSDAEVVREARDRAAIEQLMWDYVRAADTLNAEAYASVFTPDGAFGTVKGGDALRKMIADMAAGQAKRRAEGTLTGSMYHFMANQHIAFVDADRARVHYYWQTVFAGRSLETPPRLAAAGRGVDDVVRVDGRWLIENRNVAPDE